MRNVDKAAFARWDAGGYSPFDQSVTEPICIVAPVGQQGSGLWDRGQQRPRPDVVAGLACRQKHPDRATFRIGCNKAARLVEQMEENQVVTPANHVGKHEILLPEH